jgi:hypothetical protein
MAEVPITVCGSVCFRGETDQLGGFEVNVGAWLEPSRYSIAAHGGPIGSTFYVPLGSELSGTASRYFDLRVLAFNQLGAALIDKTQANAGTAQVLGAGPVHIDIPEGKVVRLAPGDVLLGDEGRKFRVREVESEFWGEFGLSSEEGRLFALGPFEAHFEGDSREPVVVRVDNDESWPPGTMVSFRALGSYLEESWLPPAAFAEFGQGQVDAKGSEIVLEPQVGDPGLQLLTWLWIVPSR